MIEYFFKRLDDRSFFVKDHALGFDRYHRNLIFDHIESLSITPHILTEYIINPVITNNYPGFQFEFDYDRTFKKLNPRSILLPDHRQDISHFLCSFNGFNHVSRKLLLAALYKFGYFDTDYVSKNFVISQDELDGHVMEFVPDQERFYRKFFIGHDLDFYQLINGFDYAPAQRTDISMKSIERPISRCFVHLVSETIGTSYYPFITEKFTHSVAMKGLFVGYAQPGWHKQLKEVYGFKLYDRIFDYRFDRVDNPIERLIDLLSMLSKFRNLSISDWNDLRAMEQESIDHNFDHYYSGAYIKHIQRYHNAYQD